MASNLKNRIDRIDKQVKPKRYATIDDLIFQAHCGDKENLTFEERQRIEETKDLPLHPKLEKAFKRIEDRHRQREDSADGPR